LIARRCCPWAWIRRGRRRWPGAGGRWPTGRAGLLGRQGDVARQLGEDLRALLVLGALAELDVLELGMSPWSHLAAVGVGALLAPGSPVARVRARSRSARPGRRGGGRCILCTSRRAEPRGPGPDDPRSTRRHAVRDGDVGWSSAAASSSQAPRRPRWPRRSRHRARRRKVVAGRNAHIRRNHGDLIFGQSVQEPMRSRSIWARTPAARARSSRR